MIDKDEAHLASYFVMQDVPLRRFVYELESKDIFYTKLDAVSYDILIVLRDLQLLARIIC